MLRTLQITLFVLVFLSIYSLLNIYVLARISSLLEIPRNLTWYLVFGFLASSFIIATLIEKAMPNPFSRALYILSSIWIGALLFLFSLLVIFEILNLILNLPAKTSGYIIISLGLILTLTALLNNTALKTKEIEIPLAGIKKPITIVQITDLHLGSIYKKDFLLNVVENVNALNPDAVMITGDLFDGSAPVEEHMIDPLNALKAPSFYIIGNHEIYDGLENVLPLIEKTKVKILRDNYSSWNNLTILGVDYAERKDHLISSLDNINYPKDKPIILLYHAPTTKADELEKKNISVHLAGHTHNGQFYPFTWIVKLAFPYSIGLYSSKSNSTYVYVSPGTGTWGPPMRLGSKREITKITLVPKN